ncbi:MAG: hypothetical protein IPK39_09100 [Sulfuritalea sp.]|nr:hypothetical protein [Sulfuritalea sp.]
MHLTRFFHLKRESERFALVIAVVLLGTTAADRLGLSVPMALLCGGTDLCVLSRGGISSRAFPALPVLCW